MRRERKNERDTREWKERERTRGIGSEKREKRKVRKRDRKREIEKRVIEKRVIERER